jgi:hypothetical protein
MRRVATLSVGLLAAFHVPGAHAAKPLDSEMAVLAKQVHRELERLGNAVAMGEFTGPVDLASTGGPRIASSLRGQLEKLGVTISRKATVVVRGSYRPATDDKSKLAALMISARLEESKTGKQLVELQSRGVFDLTEISAVTGTTISAPTDTAPEVREQAISKALDDIQAPFLKGTRISASEKSPYAIEILVGPDPGAGLPDLSKYRPCAPACDGDGLAFLKINRGEVYAVKVINDSKHDAAVTLTIDGLSMFAFSEKKNYEVVIVPAGRSGIVPGWHRTNEKSDSFQVAEYAKTAVAKEMPNSSSIGTIHASFKAAWAKDAQPPADEPTSPPGARDADATARGKPIDAKFAEVVRNIGRLREAVSVRYNKAGDPSDLPSSKPGR